MPTVPVLGAKGEAGATLELSAEVFGVEIRVPLLHQAVTRELADRRAGTHDTKGRSEVSGGGKPFGPTPRSYVQHLPREMRRGALRAAVAAKIAGGELTVVEDVEVTDGKTKTLVGRLTGLGLPDGSTLLVVRELTDAIARAARNVRWLTVEPPSHVSVYQLLRARRVVFERAALLALQEMLKP